jgi:hypothetical protein
VGGQTFGLLTQKGFQMMPSFIKMLELTRAIGDPAEEFVKTVSGLDDLVGKIRDLLSICREKQPESSMSPKASDPCQGQQS